MQPAELARRPADDRALDRPRLARGDQLPGERAQESVRDGCGSQRAQPAQVRDRPAEQRVVGEAAKELRMVVVDAEDEPRPFEARLAERLNRDGAVGRLPGPRLLQPALAHQGHRQHAVAEAAGRVAPVPGREPERVGAFRPDLGDDHAPGL